MVYPEFWAKALTGIGKTNFANPLATWPFFKIWVPSKKSWDDIRSLTSKSDHIINRQEKCYSHYIFTILFQPIMGGKLQLVLI